MQRMTFRREDVNSSGDDWWFFLAYMVDSLV